MISTAVAVLTVTFIVRPTVQIVKQPDGSSIIRHNTELDMPNCKPITKTELLCPAGTLVVTPVE